MTNGTATRFGEVLRNLRESRGLSARALAKAANLANSYVTQVEQGTRGDRPRRDSVLALAQALRLTPTETGELLEAAGLFNGEDKRRPTFEEFLAGEPLLKSDQKQALLATYRTYIRANPASR